MRLSWLQIMTKVNVLLKQHLLGMSSDPGNLEYHIPSNFPQFTRMGRLLVVHVRTLPEAVLSGTG